MRLASCDGQEQKLTLCTTSESSNAAKVLKTAKIENNLLKRSDYGYLSIGRTAEPLCFACVIRSVKSKVIPSQARCGPEGG